MIVSFVASVPAADRKVYQVFAFNFWDNLLAKPSLVEYAGPKHLIFNASSQCVRGIDEPIAHETINAMCLTKTVQDPRLMSWKATTSTQPEWFQMETEVKQVWPYTFVYCFPLEIRIGEFQGPCPPFVFQVDASQQWQTFRNGTSNYVYDPRNVEFKTSWRAKVLTNIEVFHFNSSESREINATKAYKLVQELMKANAALEDSSIWFRKEEWGPVTYQLATKCLSAILTAIIFLVLYREYRRYTLIRAHAKDAERSRRRAARQASDQYMSLVPRASRPAITLA